MPLKLECENYIDMMYNQILPDYVEGLIVETDSHEMSKNLIVNFFFISNKTLVSIFLIIK